MSEPIGWNVYNATSGKNVTFMEFIPNEPALAAAAEAMADEIVQRAADGGL